MFLNSCATSACITSVLLYCGPYTYVIYRNKAKSKSTHIHLSMFSDISVRLLTTVFSMRPHCEIELERIGFLPHECQVSSGVVAVVCAATSWAERLTLFDLLNVWFSSSVSHICVISLPFNARQVSSIFIITSHHRVIWCGCCCWSGWVGCVFWWREETHANTGRWNTNCCTNVPPRRVIWYNVNIDYSLMDDIKVLKVIPFSSLTRLI